MWPGVSALPDYKPTFPRWSVQDVSRVVPDLDPAGIDMLKVCLFSFFILSLTSLDLISVSFLMILLSVFRVGVYLFVDVIRH